MAKTISEIENYQPGDLSNFPDRLDTAEELYANIKNCSITSTLAKISMGAKVINVYDTTLFPEEGIIRINDELIYYQNKENQKFYNLIRGFNNSRIMTHNVGAVVLGCVSSLHNNVIRDAILKLQYTIGLTEDLPNLDTLTSQAKLLDLKFLTPNARFLAFPTIGPAPLTVNFKNISLGTNIVKVLWDFGDISFGNGRETYNTFHTYNTSGTYNVTLMIQDQDGRISKIKKNNYITVQDQSQIQNALAYIRETVHKTKISYDNNGFPEYNSSIPLTLEFVDQSSGDIIYRKWNFGDGTSEEIFDQNENSISHTYMKQGIYWPVLLVKNIDGIIKRYTFQKPVVAGIGIKIDDENQVFDSSNRKHGVIIIQ